MEKRVLAAIGLSIAILFAFRYIQERRMPAPVGQRTPVQQTAPQVVETPRQIESAPPQPMESQLNSIPDPRDTVAEAQNIIVQGDLYRATLDNRGAVLTSWRLNQYKAVDGELFEMIAPNPGSVDPYPASLSFGDPSLNSLANQEHYEVEVNGGSVLGDLAPPVTVVMRLRRGDISIEKEFSFDRDTYLVEFSVSCRQAGRPLEPAILLGEDIGPEIEHLSAPAYGLKVITNNAGEVDRESPPESEDETQRIEGELRWVGLDMQYFTALAIPERPINAFEVQKRTTVARGLDGKEVNRDLARLTLPVAGSARYRIYLGPKYEPALNAIEGTDLTGVIDYGFFSILVRPLLFGLKWIERYIHNYGFSIVLLTLILTLMLFPIRFKQMRSMKKMQAVQPKVKQIQEKYKKYKKTDPKRAEMNQEVMALYKEHGVNPLGGCLPLLLQMPLLFAFYRLLASSIELRQAPFIGWIVDLSAKDPYYILPIVMGITMFASQKMTPMSPGGDPSQAKIMMMMPVVLTVMFLNVSSGLNLYFLCSNIFQVGIQKAAERWVGDKQSPRKPNNKRKSAAK